MRELLYKILSKDDNNVIAKVYESLMLIVILVSIIPLMCISSHPILRVTEKITVSIFIVDYLLRWYTAPMKLRRGWISYLVYPFTPMAIIDLLSILPGINVLNQTFKLFRLTRLLRIVRVFKIFRHSKKISVFMKVLRKEKTVLMSVMVLALFYIFVTALIMFNTEPHINPTTGQVTFSSFLDALYWATVTLTTVGYGDLCPVTEIGRVVSMLSSLFGVAIIALPSGVITASYLEELRNSKDEK